MPPMVDAEKLKRRLERRTAIARLNLPFISQVIDDLSVEVPDTPDVLGKLRKWLNEKASVLRDKKRRERLHTAFAAYKGQAEAIEATLFKLDELQAKKEAVDEPG